MSLICCKEMVDHIQQATILYSRWHRHIEREQTSAGYLQHVMDYIYKLRDIKRYKLMFLIATSVRMQ